jgi:CheY-like chemotaxis protein
LPTAHIEETADTTSLLEKVFTGDWDLVISDLAMPGGGGFFALKKIIQAKKNFTGSYRQYLSSRAIPGTCNKSRS